MLNEQLELPAAFASLVPGELVHRRHLSDVLVTGAERMSEDSFECFVQWPRNHVLLGRNAGTDSTLVAETARQVTTYLAHTMYAVPLGQQFLMTRLELQRIKVEMILKADRRLSVSVRFEDAVKSRNGLSRFICRLDVFEDGTLIGSAATFGRLLTPAAYARTRDVEAVTAAAMPRVRSTQIAPSRVGVFDDDLVIVRESKTLGCTTLALPVDHPAFFDHALDHVPGMALLEAVRQTVRHALGRPEADFVAAALAFHRMVELSGTTTLHCSAIETAESGISIAVDVAHDARLAATATVTVSA